MSKRFFGPLLSLWDPILARNILPKGGAKRKQGEKKDYAYQDRTQDDPNETFDNFFKDKIENPNDLNEEEKGFFQKFYPNKFGKKFNPYETLGVDENADFEKIKEAYRKNSLKYHPKVDTSAEAQNKFNDISRAFNELSQKQTDDYGEDISSKSLFKDFDDEVESFDKKEKKDQLQEGESKQQDSENRNQFAHHSKEGLDSNQIRNSSQLYNYNLGYKEKHKDHYNQNQQEHKKTNEQNEKSNKSQTQSEGQNKNQENKPQSLKGAELYSESSFFEFIDGRRKLHITRVYGKDGRTIKVDRIEDHLHDGSIEVNETFDDGKDVRHKKFVTGQKSKQLKE